jgi:hypothetical protein
MSTEREALAELVRLQDLRDRAGRLTDAVGTIGKKRA